MALWMVILKAELRTTFLFLFDFFIFSDTKHFAEGKRQIVVQIKNSVYGKAEGSGYEQINPAPETIHALGDVSQEPFPYMIEGVSFPKGKGNGAAAETDIFLPVACFYQSADKSLCHIFIMEGNGNPHSQV